MRLPGILYLLSFLMLSFGLIGRWFLDAPWQDGMLMLLLGLVLWTLAEVQDLHGEITQRDKSVSK